ncbi:MAG: AsmA-like C-terminal region-containing protein [Verrucomicrobium sp.]|nr:AsmA-like C-terminal region-containing protein [Verrucomicrobium sp.]
MEAVTLTAWHRLRRFLAQLSLSTLGAVALGVLAVFLILRFYGLPPQVKNYLLRELRARGLNVSIGRVLLDPAGAVIARNVRVYRTPAQDDLLVGVSRVRLGIGWFSWWQGRPFLQSAEVSNATVRFPLTERTTAALEDVHAHIEFNSQGLVVRSAEARILNLLVSLRGAILLNGPLPRPKVPDDPDAARLHAQRLEAAWRQAEDISGRFDPQHPLRLHIDFTVPTASPLDATARVVLSGHDVRFSGALVREIGAEAAYANQVATLSALTVQLSRGALTVTGEADLKQQRAHAEFYSDLDFTPLAVALPWRAGEAVSRLDFGDLPVFSGHAEGSWKDAKPDWKMQADVDWENFTYGGAPFRRLVIPIACDGQRLFIPTAVLESDRGSVRLDALYDRAIPSMRAKLDSNLDITLLTGLVSPAFDRFLESLHFNVAGPVASITVSGSGNDPRQWLLSGHAKVENCSYKKIALDSLETDFTFQDLVLGLKNFTVRRPEGTVRGEFQDDFGRRIVRIGGLAADVDLQAVAPALGNKFAGYVAPYRFDKPPKAKFSGLVDLNDDREKLETNLVVDFDSPGTLHYMLYKYPLDIAKAKGRLRVEGRSLSLRCDEGQLFDGKLNGTLGVGFQTKDPSLRASFKLDGGDFHQAMSKLYKNEQASGTVTLQMSLAGILGNLSSFTGDGSIGVENGYILSIPFLGGLSNLVGAIIPGFGASKADHGSCTFKIADGVLHTDDLTISSLTFSAIGNGQADYVRNALDFDVRVNVRGIVGLLLFPVSKLFEYHGSGTLENPVWKSKIL